MELYNETPLNVHLIYGQVLSRVLTNRQAKRKRRMQSEMLFEAALSIVKPWYIKDVQFDTECKRLDIYIDFKRGSSSNRRIPIIPKNTKPMIRLIRRDGI